MNQLAEYSSSEEDATSHESKKRPASNHNSPNTKKRKLPGVSKSLISPGPADDPSKHQGRIRTHAHVEGQFASYIYVPINIGNDGIKEMFKIVKKALRFVMKSEPLIQPIIEDFERVTRGNDDCELHISLSRPVYLFHHQREAFKQAVKIMASSQTSFPASFAQFTAFENDEKTRAFVAMEVGAGHSEFHKLVDGITPTLRSLYQKEYYLQPRFHASIAWALLKTRPGSTSVTSPPALSDLDLPAKEEKTHFPILPSIPSELIAGLNDTLAKQLNRITFNVNTIRVQIGKQTTTYALQSSR